LDSSVVERDDLFFPQGAYKSTIWGAMTKILEVGITFPKQSNIDIEFSNIGQTAGIANNNVVHPLLLHTPAHMQSTTGNLTEKRVFRMYNQFGIHLGLKPGDSGTCIYIIENPNKNGCIGMAIAVCDSLTVVTPLKDILNRMAI
jgi:hypothetical protein